MENCFDNLEYTYNFYKDDFKLGQMFFEFMYEDSIFRAASKL